MDVLRSNRPELTVEHYFTNRSEPGADWVLYAENSPLITMMRSAELLQSGRGVYMPSPRGESWARHLRTVEREVNTSRFMQTTLVRDLTLAAVDSELFDLADMQESASAVWEWEAETHHPWQELFGGITYGAGYFVKAHAFLVRHGLVDGNRTTVEGHRVVAAFGGSIQNYHSHKAQVAEVRPTNFVTIVNTSGDSWIANSRAMSGAPSNRGRTGELGRQAVR